MPEKPRSLEIGSWPGLFSNVSPHQIPPGGGQVQSNMATHIQGELRVRQGMRPTTFAVTAAAVTAEIVAMCTFIRPEARWTVYETTSGLVKAGRGAT